MADEAVSFQNGLNVFREGGQGAGGNNGPARKDGNTKSGQENHCRPGIAHQGIGSGLNRFKNRPNRTIGRPIRQREWGCVS